MGPDPVPWPQLVPTYRSAEVARSEPRDPRGPYLPHSPLRDPSLPVSIFGELHPTLLPLGTPGRPRYRPSSNPPYLKRRLSARRCSASHAFKRPHLATQAPPPRAARPIVRARARARHMSAGQSRTDPHLTSQSRVGSTPSSPMSARWTGHREAFTLGRRCPYSVIRVPQKDRGSTCQAPLETMGGSGGSLEDIAGRLQRRKDAPAHRALRTNPEGSARLALA